MQMLVSIQNLKYLPISQRILHKILLNVYTQQIDHTLPGSVEKMYIIAIYLVWITNPSNPIKMCKHVGSSLERR